jgi:hypothetical protein
MSALLSLSDTKRTSVICRYPSQFSAVTRPLFGLFFAIAATRILDVDRFPDMVTLAWFEPHLVCKRCGGKATAAGFFAVQLSQSYSAGWPSVLPPS